MGYSKLSFLFLNRFLIVSINKQKLQYQIRRRQPGYATTTALFGDVPVVRHTYNCTGGKACPYMPVQSFRHTEITVDLEARIARLREQIKQVNCRTKAIGYVILFRTV